MHTKIKNVSLQPWEGTISKTLSRYKVFRIQILDRLVRKRNRLYQAAKNSRNESARKAYQELEKENEKAQENKNIMESTLAAQLENENPDELEKLCRTTLMTTMERDRTVHNVT